jgi:hypothetical protein
MTSVPGYDVAFPATAPLGNDVEEINTAKGEAENKSMHWTVSS